MVRFAAVGAAVLLVVAVAPGAASTNGLRGALALRTATPPPEPKVCKSPAAGNRGITLTGTEWSDALCGTRAPDNIVAVGGNDHAWGYQGVDDFGARNGWPDEVYGGPGNDKGRFDPCDKVVDVENKSVGGSCPGVTQRRFAAAGTLPYVGPVVECYRSVTGERIIDVLLEPEMRAVDATARVDFQTVAWSPALLRIDSGTPVLVDPGSTWFWDRVYDNQVKAFAGNYWRGFGTGIRTFVRYVALPPGEYVVGAYLHWYANEDGPARDEITLARAHYGPAEKPDQQACVFPN